MPLTAEGFALPPDPHTGPAPRSNADIDEELRSRAEARTTFAPVAVARYMTLGGALSPSDNGAAHASAAKLYGSSTSASASAPAKDSESADGRALLFKDGHVPTRAPPHLLTRAVAERLAAVAIEAHSAHLVRCDAEPEERWGIGFTAENSTAALTFGSHGEARWTALSGLPSLADEDVQYEVIPLIFVMCFAVNEKAWLPFGAPPDSRARAATMRRLEAQLLAVDLEIQTAFAKRRHYVYILKDVIPRYNFPTALIVLSTTARGNVVTKEAVRLARAVAYDLLDVVCPVTGPTSPRGTIFALSMEVVRVLKSLDSKVARAALPADSDSSASVEY
jgi:hypothetical protein